MIVKKMDVYVHEVLVNRIGGLSLPRKSVVRLTDHLVHYVDVKQHNNNWADLQIDLSLYVRIIGLGVSYFTKWYC